MGRQPAPLASVDRVSADQPTSRSGRLLATVAAAGALPAVVIGVEMLTLTISRHLPPPLRMLWLLTCVLAASAGMVGALAGAWRSQDARQRAAFQISAITLAASAVFWSAGYVLDAAQRGVMIPGALSNLSAVFFLLPVMVFGAFFPIVVPAIALAAAIAAFATGGGREP